MSFVRPLPPPPHSPHPPPSTPKDKQPAYCRCTKGAAVRCYPPLHRYLAAASNRGRQRTPMRPLSSAVLTASGSRGVTSAPFQGLTSIARTQRRVERTIAKEPCNFSSSLVALSLDAKGILSGNGRVEVPSHAP